MKIVVIGELCVDKFIYCESKRLSPEAPVPILNPIKTTSNAGMAGNVLANVKVLKPNSSTDFIYQKKLITKTRYVDGKSNHMFFRIDEGEDNIDNLVWNEHLEYLIKESDITIVSDYNKGFLDDNDLYKIGHFSQLSILDTKRNLSQDIADKFTFIKLNENEFKSNKHLDSKNIIVTLGSKGAYYNNKLIPQSNPQQTIDVSGAGDTFTAAFITNYFDFNDVENAIVWANTVAGKVVTKRGVVTPV